MLVETIRATRQLYQYVSLERFFMRSFNTMIFLAIIIISSCGKKLGNSNQLPQIPNEPKFDFRVVNDNSNIDALITGASSAICRVYCDGPLVTGNMMLRIRVAHFANGIQVDEMVMTVMDPEGEMQNAGLYIVYGRLYNAPVGDYARFTVDCEGVYNESDESNNTVDIPFVYVPLIIANT